MTGAAADGVAVTLAGMDGGVVSAAAATAGMRAYVAATKDRAMAVATMRAPVCGLHALCIIRRVPQRHLDTSKSGTNVSSAPAYRCCNTARSKRIASVHPQYTVCELA